MAIAITVSQKTLREANDRALATILSAHTVAATLWLLFATAVGILLAYKFGAPDFGSGAWLTFGRLRPIHTNAIWLGQPRAGRAGVLRCRT